MSANNQIYTLRQYNIYNYANIVLILAFYLSIIKYKI